MFISKRVINLIKNQQIITKIHILYKVKTELNIINFMCSFIIFVEKAKALIHIKTDNGFFAASKNASSQTIFVFSSLKIIL